MSELLHPSEAVPGFTKRVTLSSGTICVVRKVSLEAITIDATRHVLSTSTLLREANEHAKEGADANRATSKIPPRPLADMGALQAESGILVAQRVLRGALVHPKLEVLMAQYGARMEDCDPDLGLGPDFDTLMLAVNELNPVLAQKGGEVLGLDAPLSAEARFPDVMGSDA